MLQANCRSRFTADDFQFVVTTLARNPGEQVSLVELLSDEDSRDQVLDHEAIYQELLENTACLKVSPAFYFYVLTRRVLKEAGIQDKILCDYIASILVSFAKSKGYSPACIETALETAFPYISDLLQLLSDASSHQVFLIRIHLGNYSLFLSGIFAERVKAHSKLRGGPSLSFYEEIGQTNYHIASSHRMARSFDLNIVFEGLAQEFSKVRRALNHLAEDLLHLNPYLSGKL